MPPFPESPLPSCEGLLVSLARLPARDLAGGFLEVQRLLDPVDGLQRATLCALGPDGVVPLAGHDAPWIDAIDPERRRALVTTLGRGEPVDWPGMDGARELLLPVPADGPVPGALLLGGTFTTDRGTMLAAGQPLLGACAWLLERHRHELDRAGDARLAGLGRLTVSVAHELGGPLQAITSLAEVLSSHPDHEQREESARRILRSALRCRSMAQDLLSFASPAPHALRSVRVADVLLDALELDRFSDVGEVQVEIDDPDALPAIRTDPRRLTQVLLNLLTNARHALGEVGRPGVVRVHVTLEGSERDRDERILFRVTDDGPGVPAAMADRLFEPFVSSRSSGEGTGLGLWISRQLVEDLGGTLDLDREHPGPGASFVITLPIGVGVRGGRPTPPPVAPPGKAPLPPLDVLVVDDDREVLETYEVVLALGGHRVVTVDRLETAIQTIEDRRFDAILCDMRLPDGEGLDLHRRLETQDPDQARRIVFATGDVMNDELRDRLAAIANPVLFKPFRAEDLDRALEEASNPEAG